MCLEDFKFWDECGVCILKYCDTTYISLIIFIN